MRGADVVRSSQGAPDITPNLKLGVPLWAGRKQNAFNFSLCADAEVVTLKVSEGRPMVRRYKRSGDGDCNRAEKVSISDITDQFMELNKAETATPNKKNVEVYR